MSELPTPIPSPPPDSGDWIDLAPGVRVAGSAVRLQYARSRGPGGQNVNKVNSKSELWVPVSAIVGLTERAAQRLRQFAGKRLLASDELHIASDSHRTQEMNREAVFDRLRELVEQAVHEPRPRRKTKPSKAAKRRRVEAKRHRSQIKSNRRPGGHDD
jgi:ribosome-associated protein